jgi:hypothetical protein
MKAEGESFGFFYVRRNRRMIFGKMGMMVDFTASQSSFPLSQAKS